MLFFGEGVGRAGEIFVVRASEGKIEGLLLGIGVLKVSAEAEKCGGRLRKSVVAELSSGVGVQRVVVHCVRFHLIFLAVHQTGLRLIALPRYSSTVHRLLKVAAPA